MGIGFAMHEKGGEALTNRLHRSSQPESQNLVCCHFPRGWDGEYKNIFLWAKRPGVIDRWSCKDPEHTHGQKKKGFNAMYGCPGALTTCGLHICKTCYERRRGRVERREKMI